MNSPLNGLPEICLRTSEEESRFSQDELVLNNLREGVAYAQKCCRGNLPIDELLSLCYQALIHAAKNFRPGGPTRFFAYAKPYVRGAICTEYRFKDTVKNCKPAVPEENGAPVELSQGPAYDEMELRERWAFVRPLLSKLTEHERMILDLRHQGGFSYEKIGQMLEVSREAIRCSHELALHKIQRELRRKKIL